MDAEARIEALQAMIERQREEIRRLEEALGFGHLMPPEWCLTVKESRLLGALLERDIMTKDGLMSALYRDLGKDEPELKIIDVFVCKIRRKLREAGVEGIRIETVWGQGYRLPPADKEKLRALVSDALAWAA